MHWTSKARYLVSSEKQGNLSGITALYRDFI